VTGDARIRPTPHGPRPTSHTHWDALHDATLRLEDISESPQLDAEVLLRHVTGLDRARLFTRYERVLPEQQHAAFEVLVARRVAGEPIPYILGRRWFRYLELRVDERVLIPRPETEAFVDYALAWLRAHPGPRRVVDVGTGSGAIALALASELKANRDDVLIVATERYQPALEVAKLNRDELDLRDRVHLVQADLLAGLPGPFDVILANLPYLAPGQEHHSTRLEPDEALFGGPDGFDLHRALLRQSVHALAPGGLWVGEIDPRQAELGAAFARETTGLPVRVDEDLAGLARYLIVGHLSS
jgi:release factor glutamine methyltransferase